MELPLARTAVKRLCSILTGVSLAGASALAQTPQERGWCESEDAVNTAFRQAAAGSLKGILDVSDEPLVSVDYIGSFYSSVVDSMSTAVIDGNLVHVSSWYDNEMGYSARCVDLLAYIGRRR